MLDENAEKLAKTLFKKYYESVDFSADNIEEREFGFGNFEKKIAFRHYAFKDTHALKKYVIENVPAFISLSNSHYKYPDARPMEKKLWLGSELIFDLDASDLHLACQEVHGRSWVCDNCLLEVKDETIKLIEEFLIPDFGFSKNDISVNFSGNRGYHVHVNNEDVFPLTSEQRRGISEYISGINMNVNAFFPTLGQTGKRLIGPKPDDYGWGGRLARGIITTLNKGTDSLQKLGIDPKIAKKLEASKADIIFGITTGNWDKISIPKKAEFWSKVINSMAIVQSDSIDKNVTNDIHHLIRMHDTLHGDTGLVGRRLLSINELNRFEPMIQSIAFWEGTLDVLTDKVPKFSMNGKEFGPYEKVKVELPTYAGLYLLLKGVATLSKSAK
jgi:DNA primase small subunit